MKNKFSKTDQRILVTATSLLLLFSILLYDDSFLRKWSKNSTPVVAKIVESDNDVRQKFASEFQWEKVRGSQAIHFGDSLFTGDNSHAWIELDDGSQFYVNQNSLIVFNMTSEQLQLALKFGTLGGQLNGFLKLDGLDLCGKDANFKIEAKGDGTYKVQDAKGGLYTDCDKKPKPLTKDLSIDPKRGVIERAPTEALVSNEPPEITYPEPQAEFYFKINHFGELIESSHIRVKWKVKKITTYEIQYAKDPEFKQIFASQESNVKSTTSPALDEGNYFVRVRDHRSKNAPWSKSVAFEVKHALPAQLPAPRLTLPNYIYRVPSKVPLKMEWAPVPGAIQYQLEISDDDDFAQKQSFVVKNPELVLSKYEAGKFFYRVTGISKVGGAGAVSGVGRLTIIANRPILDPVDPKETEAKNEEDVGAPTEFKVSWSSNPLAKNYFIEVAPTADFKNAKQYESRSPASVVQVPQVGDYYWRVKPMDGKNKALSEFSDTGQMIYRFKDAPLPPKLLEPLDKMTLFFQDQNKTPFWLEWKGQRNAQKYIIEVSRYKDFSEILMTRESQQPRLLLKDKLPRGVLYWRVRAEDKEKRQSLWSNVRSFQLFAGRAALSE